MTNDTHIHPFERDDYPFPGQCVAIINPKSETKAKRCAKPSGVHIANHFPVCPTHREYLDADTFSSSSAELIHMLARRVDDLESELLDARGSAAEWRRLARARHGSLVEKFYVPVLPKDSFVYFVQGGDYIKIGKADNPAVRFAQLQLGGVIMPEDVRPADIKLVGVERGGLDREAELHRNFAGTRVAGEWFHADESLVGYIHALPEISSPQWGDVVRHRAVSAMGFCGLPASKSA